MAYTYIAVRRLPSGYLCTLPFTLNIPSVPADPPRSSSAAFHLQSPSTIYSQSAKPNSARSVVLFCRNTAQNCCLFDINLVLILLLSCQPPATTPACS